MVFSVLRVILVVLRSEGLVLGLWFILYEMWVRLKRLRKGNGMVFFLVVFFKLEIFLV